MTRLKRRRIARSADFERARKRGFSRANRQLVLYALDRGDEESARLGLSVSRRVGGAVERNRIKRLLREAFENEQASLPSGLDLVVVARPDAADLDSLAATEAALGELVTAVTNARESATVTDGASDERSTEGSE